MIGNYPRPVSCLREADRPRDPVVEVFRHELRRGCLALAVMSALGRAEHHGYGLRKTLAGGGIEVEPGTLYPLLRRLEAKGLLSSEWREHGKRRRRSYRLTPHGGVVLERLLDEWRHVDAAIGRMSRRRRSEAA